MPRSVRPRITALWAAAFFAVMVAVLTSHNGPASAQSTAAVPGATITVDTAQDESNAGGDCSLREAIEAADTNEAVGGCAAGSARKRDAIRFSLGQGAATIALGGTLPAVTDAAGLTINGGRDARIVVSGGGEVRVFVVKKGARIKLLNLTVAGGSAANGSGGVVSSRGALKVVRSTFSDNEAIGPGGGIASLSGAGALKVVNSTFSGNRAEFVGGAIQNANAAAARAKIGDTIFANNLANDTKDNVNNACAAGTCRGTITDGGYNISDDKSFRFGAPTSRTNVDPRLEPGGPQDNGGPTDTIALQGDSPAVDFTPKGRNGCGAAVNVDQRGVKRPQGNRCDAGAFEWRASPR
jgi:CSLREA domain-containing protein